MKKEPTQAQRFVQYLQVHLPEEREAFLARHIGRLHDEKDAMKKEIAQLKRRLTKLEKITSHPRNT